MVRPAPRSAGRGGPPARARLGEGHGHREEAVALGPVDRTEGGLAALGHGTRDLEFEPAAATAEVVQRHGGRPCLLSSPDALPRGRVTGPSYPNGRNPCPLACSWC